MFIYDQVFKDSGYNKPDKKRIELVRSWLKGKGDCVLDVGCGKGNYLKPLSREFKITGIEPSQTALDKLKGHEVFKTDILGFKGKFDAYYCVDVLEHISPEDIDKNLEKLSTFAPIGLLGIANHSDMELHLIQEDSDWWQKKLEQHFKRVVLIHVEPRYYMFEVSNDI